MKILNDSITKMPTMVTVNQNQMISSHHSSKASEADLKKVSSRKGVFAAAGNTMIGVPDSSRNNN